MTRTGLKGLVGWWALLLLTAAALRAVRGSLETAHVALLLLLVVLGGSAFAGRRIGLSLVAGSFVIFDVWFLPPYGTLLVQHRLDWLVLVAYLVTCLVAAHLLERARHEADRAAALREADRLKDTFIASISHDLRTPLTTIKAHAHDLRESGDERAEIIEQEADRLTRLVGDLLDLSRLSVSSFPLRIEVNAIDDLLGIALQRVEALFGKDGIDVSLSGEHALLFGRFDLAQSARVLVNLLENARKYGGSQGAVQLVVRREPAHVALDVIDRGPGVEPAAVESIFDPFYRPQGAPPDVVSAGLGLAIARRLADAQQGTLTYAAAPGGGSVFTFRIPSVDASEISASDD